MNNTKPLIILKLGGSVITDKASAVPKINYEIIIRLAKEIQEAYCGKDNFRLILVHGGGSYAHKLVKDTGIDKGITNGNQILAFAEVQRMQNTLNAIVTERMIEMGLPAIPCQASSSVVMKGGRIRRFEVEPVQGLLETGLIPVLYGVPAYDTEQKGCSILSGDQIAPYIAKSLNAVKIIHCTNVDGIFTADPTTDKDAKPIKEINRQNITEVMKMLSGSSTTDVTGGMAGKVQEIAKIGIETQIVSALIPGRVKQALLGEDVGTTIRL